MDVLCDDLAVETQNNVFSFLKNFYNEYGTGLVLCINILRQYTKTMGNQSGHLHCLHGKMISLECQ